MKTQRHVLNDKCRIKNVFYVDFHTMIQNARCLPLRGIFLTEGFNEICSIHIQVKTSIKHTLVKRGLKLSSPYKKYISGFKITTEAQARARLNTIKNQFVFHLKKGFRAMTLIL